jgi:hypothetical protein
MENNNNSAQKQINKMEYENHMRILLLKMEDDCTQISSDNIKTHDLGLITLAIVNKLDIKESPNEQGLWIIKNNNNMQDFYKKYKNKETLVEPVVFSKTLLNIISKK